MKEFWNQRYKNGEFAYGVEPNEFFKKSLVDYSLQGTILLPAEGEGRNAVFAARSGLKVTAFDYSEEGQKKALKLAEANNVQINYFVGEISKQKFEKNSFDLIALVFAHFPKEFRSQYHLQLSQYIKKNGIIILEGFSKKHITTNKMNQIPSGPKDINMLFSIEEIKNDFPGFEIIQLDEEEIELDEGPYHKGKASVIRFIGRKK